VTKFKVQVMCLSIPSKVISINGNKATVSVGGTEYEASLQLVEDVEIGDYVLLHTGFAIQKISEEDANETMKLLRELGAIDEKIREEEAKKI
jgi:hydrogenase expression/formation protein HypC